MKHIVGLLLLSACAASPPAGKCVPLGEVAHHTPTSSDELVQGNLADHVVELAPVAMGTEVSPERQLQAAIARSIRRHFDGLNDAASPLLEASLSPRLRFLLLAKNLTRDDVLADARRSVLHVRDFWQTPITQLTLRVPLEGAQREPRYGGSVFFLAHLEQREPSGDTVDTWSMKKLDLELEINADPCTSGDIPFRQRNVNAQDIFPDLPTDYTKNEAETARHLDTLLAAAGLDARSFRTQPLANPPLLHWERAR